MMYAVSPQVQRVLALLLLLLVAALVWSGVIWPLFESWQGRRDEIAQDARLLDAYRRAAAAQAALEVRLQELKSSTAAQGGFLEGTNPEVLGASLQGTLRSAIEGAGGQVVSAQILPTTSEGGFRKIAVQLQFKIGTTGLPQAAYTIETRNPVLLIDHVSIRAPEGVGVPTANPDPPDLAVTWNVYGYLRGPQ